MCVSSVSRFLFSLFLFNDTATTWIYTYLHTLSLHDALPISHPLQHRLPQAGPWQGNDRSADGPVSPAGRRPDAFVLIGYSHLGKKRMTNPIEHRGPEGANFWRRARWIAIAAIQIGRAHV